LLVWAVQVFAMPQIQIKLISGQKMVKLFLRNPKQLVFR